MTILIYCMSLITSFIGIRYYPGVMLVLALTLHRVPRFGRVNKIIINGVMVELFWFLQTAKGSVKSCQGSMEIWFFKYTVLLRLLHKLICQYLSK